MRQPEWIKRVLPRRLHVQLALLFGAMFAVALTSYALYTAAEQGDAMLGLLRDHTRALTRHIASHAALAAPDASAADLAAALEHMPHFAGLLSIAVVAADGSPIVSFRRGQSAPSDADVAALSKLLPPATGMADTTVVDSTDGQPDRIVGWAPIEAKVGGRWTRVEVDTLPVRQARAHIIADSLMAATIIILLATAVVYLFMRRPMRAIRAAAKFATDLDRDYGNTIAFEAGPRETEELIYALNRASLQLAEQNDALVEGEMRKGAILEAALDCIITFDGEGRILEFNAAAESVFGYRRAEACDRHFARLLLPEDAQPLFVTGLKRYVDRGVSDIIGRRSEIIAVRKDGKRFAAEMAIAGVDLSERRLFTAYLRDISDRTRAVAELLHAKEEAEAANRIKSDFLANVSHEILTPMHAIIGMTELALDGELSADQRQRLSLARSAADDLLTLINEILEFSNIDSGRLALESIPFDLRDAVSAAVRTIAPKADKKGIELLLRLGDEIPASVVGDPQRLRQVLLSLLDNAVKFTDRGEVAVEVRCDANDGDTATLRFSIRDSGIGIPVDEQAHIFDAFSQVDRATTRKLGGPGLGLGLAISARIVKQMNGGEIRVESEPGAGSVFSFSARFGTAAAPPLRLPCVSLEDLRVLVVDDNATNRQLLIDMLRGWAMRPVAVADGREAVAANRQAIESGDPFQLILLDGGMPGSDGFDVAAKLGGTPESAAATVMMLTSAGSRGDAARCRELGVRAYLMKPVTQAELLDALIAALGVPYAAAESAPLITRHSLRETRRSLSVLLADDNEINRSLTPRLLEKLGHRVTVAESGGAAVEMALAGAYDAILMAVRLPGLSGCEAAARIRQLETALGRRTPIIAMTARATDDDEPEECIAAGMDACVDKPVLTPALVAALLEVTGTAVMQSAQA
jgi:two-component system sensor histidine kinase/response regulator